MESMEGASVAAVDESTATGPAQPGFVLKKEQVALGLVGIFYLRDLRDMGDLRDD